MIIIFNIVYIIIIIIIIIIKSLILFFDKRKLYTRQNILSSCKVSLLLGLIFNAMSYDKRTRSSFQIESFK